MVCSFDMAHITLEFNSERTCSKTLAKDAPRFERRGTPWTTLDQCEVVSVNIRGSSVISLYKMYLCTWSCRGDFCNTHLLGAAGTIYFNFILLPFSIVFLSIFQT